MDLAPKEKIIAQARAEFRAYLQSPAFQRYVRGLRRKPPLWNLRGRYQYLTAHRAFQEVGEVLADKGDLVLGLVLMRKTALAGQDAAAPGRVLGSFDISVTGMDELYATAWRITAMSEGPDPADWHAMREIFEDEEYQANRRRTLPACLEAPAHMVLFDELLRSDDFFEPDVNGARVPHPFVVLFANRDVPVLTSAVVPGNTAEMVLRFLVEERKRSAGQPGPPPRPGAASPPPA